jgi:hypothetical protein
MGLLDQASNVLRARDKCDPTTLAAGSVPPPGTYLTDGAALFRVGQTLPGKLDGGSVLELEDCGTLEILLCSAQTMARAGLRSVTPTRTA